MLFNRFILCGALCTAMAAFAHPGMHDQLARATLAIEQQPELQSLYLQRGIIYVNGSQYEQALADYKRAEQLGSPIVVAHELGLLYYHMGDFEQARRYLDRYLLQFPTSAVSYEARARVASGAGDYTQAIADLEQYFKLHDSPHPAHFISAADMLEEMGQPDAALAILDQGMERLGLGPQLQRKAVGLEVKRQRIDKAIARFETLREPLRENPSWRLQMAELLILDGRRAEAEIQLQLAGKELADLRPTPARQNLLGQIQELRQ